MLMVTNFWAWKHVVHMPRLVRLRQDYGVGLIQGGVYTELEVDEAQGWTDHLPWSHVEGGAGLRGYSVSRRGRSLFSRWEKSEQHVIQTGAQWSDGSVKLVTGRR